MLSLLLAVPSCIYSFWHGVIPTSYFIFNDFYTCILNITHTHLYTHVYMHNVKMSVYIQVQSILCVLFSTRPHPDEVESVSGLKEVPKTEDFITFLCLRGSYVRTQLIHKGLKTYHIFVLALIGGHTCTLLMPSSLLLCNCVHRSVHWGYVTLGNSTLSAPPPPVLIDPGHFTSPFLLCKASG